MRDIAREMPGYDYVYLGDNARAPYGTRSYEVVYQYTREAVLKLFGMGCRLVILACNTASAKALRTIQQHDLPLFDASRRVLGVIRPSVEAVADYTRNGHIGVLATRGTVASGSYLLEVAKIHSGKNFKVTQLACPMWVPLVENNEVDSPGAEFFVRKYLEELFGMDPGIDTLLLACTHYPLLRELIDRYVPAGVSVVQQGEIVANSLKDYLRRHPEMEGMLSRGGDICYYTTEKEGMFDRMASMFMRAEVMSRHVELK